MRFGGRGQRRTSRLLWCRVAWCDLSCRATRHSADKGARDSRELRGRVNNQGEDHSRRTRHTCRFVSSTRSQLCENHKPEATGETSKTRTIVFKKQAPFGPSRRDFEGRTKSTDRILQLRRSALRATEKPLASVATAQRLLVKRALGNVAPYLQHSTGEVHSPPLAQASRRDTLREALCPQARAWSPLRVAVYSLPRRGVDGTNGQRLLRRSADDLRLGWPRRQRRTPLACATDERSGGRGSVAWVVV